MTDFKIKMAELAAKYNISHQRDIDWHNFVAEVEQLTKEPPEKERDELMESSRALYDDIDFCIIELLRARREGSEQHEHTALSRMESLMVETQQHLSCITDYLEKENEPKWSEADEKQIRQIERIVKNAGCTQKLQEQIHNWFKSLRPQSHYTKRNELFDQCVENCDPKVMKEVSDNVDEKVRVNNVIEELKKLYEKVPDDNRDIVDVGKLIHNRRKKEDER